MSEPAQTIDSVLNDIAQIAHWYKRTPAACVIPVSSPGMENEYFFYRRGSTTIKKIMEILIQL